MPSQYFLQIFSEIQLFFIVAFGEIEISGPLFAFLIGITLFIFSTVAISSIALVKGAIEDKE